MEDCRIITSFYFEFEHRRPRWIGRLPYYYFLLLYRRDTCGFLDWKTAVLLLPSTLKTRKWRNVRLEDCRIITSFYSYSADGFKQEIGRLPYYYFLLLPAPTGRRIEDWKTAVLLLPSTSPYQSRCERRLEDCRIITSFYLPLRGCCPLMIGRLPYYYFLLLHARRPFHKAGLEDCRIITSFYSIEMSPRAS